MENIFGFVTAAVDIHKTCIMVNLNEDMGAHEDLGDFSKPTPIEKAKIYAKFQSPRVYRHESTSDTEERRSRCHEAIRRLDGYAKIAEKGPLVHLNVNGLQFDLYPGSNTWYSHAKSRFGTDIPSLIDLIEIRLLKKH